MTHEERMVLAQEIAGRIVEKYGTNIIGIVVYGSVAKHVDTEHSDLELWVATTEAIPSRDLVFIYRGCAVEVFYGPAQLFLDDAAAVNPMWPIRADMRRSYLVLFERGEFFSHLQAATRDLQAEDFDKAIREQMLWTHQIIGKLRNASAQMDDYGLLAAGRDFVFSTALLIGLANRRYYPGQRGLYRLAQQMPMQPANYGPLLDRAGGFTTHNSAEVYSAALTLWNNVQAFVANMGIDWDKDDLAI
ncbi:MAG TPA: kanamycin nucleotidyltransferase C-terminal domain-containing protein [Chloroflexia bacterium]|nr:kanamycin nucleotidyltransferase C-terminal domain-containing protein [Chloroflexia bacterium]